MLTFQDDTFTTSQEPKRLITLFATGDDDSEFFTFSRENWRIRHNVFDLTLGRSFYLSGNLSINSQVGLKEATLDQKKQRDLS